MKTHKINSFKTFEITQRGLIYLCQNTIYADACWFTKRHST